ncbi:MAG: hypothetical protein P1V97_09050 [Planctomycetota bacterium]|nr:hypothetical protein [Planctomycetota bacterium]
MRLFLITTTILLSLSPVFADEIKKANAPIEKNARAERGIAKGAGGCVQKPRPTLPGPKNAGSQGIAEGPGGCVQEPHRTLPGSKDPAPASKKSKPIGDVNERLDNKPQQSPTSSPKATDKPKVKPAPKPSAKAPVKQQVKVSEGSPWWSGIAYGLGGLAMLSLLTLLFKGAFRS